MTRFAECLPLILQHEGGWVDHPKSVMFNVHHATLKHGKNDLCCRDESAPGWRSDGRGPRLRASEQTQLPMQRARLLQPGLRPGALQRPLHPAPDWQGHDTPCEERRVRANLHRLRYRCSPQGGVGTVRATLQATSSRSHQGGACESVRGRLHSVRGSVSTRRLRLSPLRRQGEGPKLSDCQRIGGADCAGIVGLRAVVRQLPSGGA